MRCYIDGNQRTSDMFWKEVQVLLSSSQRVQLFDGQPIHLGGRTYQVITDELEEEMEKARIEKEKLENTKKYK